MGQPIAQVDAFTNRPFAGNPAAVCVLSEPRDERWMALVAREMNLAATAFIAPRPGGFDLRWFTSAVELDLCGHGTLAGAHVLWESGELAPGDPARFHTRSGMLTAVRRNGWIELDFPATPPESVDAAAAPDVIRALGVTPVQVARSRFDYLVEVDDEAAVRALQPDLALLRTVDTRGVIATSRASSAEFDVVSRFFAPGAGIDEDSVTGSSHCALGPYWSARLGRDDLVAYQASARGGVIRVGVRGDRVLLSGQAVTVLRGELI